MTLTTNMRTEEAASVLFYDNSSANSWSYTEKKRARKKYSSLKFELIEIPVHLIALPSLIYDNSIEQLVNSFNITMLDCLFLLLNNTVFVYSWNFKQVLKCSQGVMLLFRLLKCSSQIHALKWSRWTILTWKHLE